jgi:hypothetical protein
MIQTETARITWHRVRKEKARLAALAPKAEPKSVSPTMVVGQTHSPPSRKYRFFTPLASPPSRPDDGTPIMPIDAKKWNDVYWLDEKDYIVGIDNKSWSLRRRQESYAIVGRNILEALEDVLGPRLYD